MDIDDYSMLTDSSVASTQETISSSTILPTLSKGDENKQQPEGKLIPSVKDAWDALSQSKEPFTCVACCVTLDGDVKVVVGCQDMSVILYDGYTGEMLMNMGEHRGIVSAVAMTMARTGGGILMASASGSNLDRRVRVLKGINFGSSSDIGIATFLPRKTINAVEAPKAKVEKEESSRTADLVRLYQANKKAMEIGSAVASGGRSVATNELLPDMVNPDEIDSSENPFAEGGADIGHENAITCICFANLHDGTTVVVTGSADRTIKVWSESDNGSLWCTLEGHSLAIRSLACVVTNPYVRVKTGVLGEPEGDYNGGCLRIASGSNDEKVMIWDGDEGKWLMTLEGHTDKVTGVALFDSGWGEEALVCVSVSYDKTIRIWDATPAHDGVCLMVIGGGERIPAVQALSIAIVQEKSHHRSSSIVSPKAKAAEQSLENGFNDDADVIYDKNNEILNAINSDLKKKKTRSSPKGKGSGLKSNEIRLRILVGFRGKSFKVWDVMGSATKGFIQPTKGTEVKTTEPVSDVAMTATGEYMYVVMKNGSLNCYRCKLKREDMIEEEELTKKKNSDEEEEEEDEVEEEMYKISTKRDKHRGGRHSHRSSHHHGASGGASGKKEKRRSAPVESGVAAEEDEVSSRSGFFPAITSSKQCFRPQKPPRPSR